MDIKKKAILLVGSAKPEGNSSSEAIGTYLLDQLGKEGVESQTYFVHRAMRSEARQRVLHQDIDDADIFILAFPLYVDCLPYLVIKALEGIAAHRKTSSVDRQPHFLAIANCGFPEAQHNDVALEICQHFSEQARLCWMGGLSLGGGGMVGGRSLVESDGRVGNITAALGLAAQALAADKPVPVQAVQMMAKPAIPSGMYTAMGNMGWVFEATRQGALRKLRAKPFMTQN